MGRQREVKDPITRRRLLHRREALGQRGCGIDRKTKLEVPNMRKKRGLMAAVDGGSVGQTSRVAMHAMIC